MGQARSSSRPALVDGPGMPCRGAAPQSKVKCMLIEKHARRQSTVARGGAGRDAMKEQRFPPEVGGLAGQEKGKGWEPEVVRVDWTTRPSSLIQSHFARTKNEFI